MAIEALHYKEALPLINSGKKEIRLLRVHPGTWASPIHCTFSVPSLESLDVPYEALSYSWGNTILSTQHTITIGDTDVCVTETIAGALQRLRQPDKPVFL